MSSFSEFSPERVIVVYDSQQATFEGLKVGVGNIWPDESEPEVLTSGLWFFFRDDPTQDATTRARAGQRFVFKEYVVDVLGIEQDIDGQYFVALDIAANDGSITAAAG